jgi:predicted metal-dependent phosphoesterase TrpH
MGIDLHLHTSASDGTLSPSELVRYAVKRGVQAIAITDHDTIDGNEEAIGEGHQVHLTVIPGVEISVDYSSGSMHMLGYLFDNQNESLREKLKLLQKFRAERNPRIAEKLTRLGMPTPYEEVVQLSGGGQVGRPHFARFMIEKGYVRSEQEAFEKYLKKGALAYEEKVRFSPSDAVALILGAQGVPVLAHPFTLNCKGPEELDHVVKGLVEAGLKGIEVFYPEHSEKETLEYQRLADRYGLIVTGGSDFHGNGGSGIDLGTGRGNLNVPYELLNTLYQAKEKIGKELGNRQ